MDKKILNKYILEALKKKKEEETTEVTATGGGYGYSSPAFSMWSEDEVAKSEYKTKKDVKQIEANEVTASSSVGPYDANSFQDINMKGNTVKGQGSSWNKAQIPGGSFVSVKEKCKTFPYCNQGDINALDIRKPKKTRKKKTKLQEAIENVSLRTGLDVETIKYLLFNKLGNNS